MTFRPPLDAVGVLEYLRPRCIPGVEAVRVGRYTRTLRAGGTVGVRPQAGTVAVDIRGDRGAGRRIARRLLDLDADPDAVASTFGPDRLLGSVWRRHPGVRVPGCAEGFELACRALLGQQVSVAGATTLAGRLVAMLGTPAATEPPLSHTFPAPEAIADAPLERIGLPRTRAAALRALGAAVASGSLRLEPGAEVEDTRGRLLQLPGVGPWTAEYVALRALGDRDAFPGTDLGLRRAAERLGASASSLADTAEAWRPYRAYAAMLLWWSLA
ncbi:MAG: hypothetical protein M3024_10170 [Candidatus Dormibacteraeota bacterium]|nr:hypothetical protein [Candidatus Dormibacteraeota bacterium]